VEGTKESGPRAGANTGDALVPAQPGPAPESDHRRWWRVLCRDVQSIRRYLTVLVNRDRVVLVGPPGRTVVLSSGDAGRLSEALRRAAEQARE